MLPGVVQEDVDATQLGDRLPDRLVDLVLGGHVAGQRHGPDALGLEVARRAPSGVAVDVGNGHCRALLAEGAPEGAAETDGPAGDEHDLALEPHAHRLGPGP